MLAREITDLAGLRLSRVARRLFAALVWVQVSEGTRAVAVGGDRRVVDVVDCSGNVSPANTVEAR